MSVKPQMLGDPSVLASALDEGCESVPSSGDGASSGDETNGDVLRCIATDGDEPRCSAGDGGDEPSSGDRASSGDETNGDVLRCIATDGDEPHCSVGIGGDEPLNGDEPSTHASLRCNESSSNVGLPRGEQ